MLKILHVFFAKSIVSQGIINQLSFEVEAAKKIENCVWDTKYWLPGYYKEPHIKGFKNSLLSAIISNIKFYIWLNKVSSQYDYVIMRYPTYDPFAFLFKPKCKYLTIHHSKELSENNFFRYKILKQFIAKYISEKLILKSSGVIGVTNEIAMSAVKKSSVKQVYVLPNGVDFNSYQLSIITKSKDSRYIHLIFIAASISPWHGIDRIINAVEHDHRFKLFIIGGYGEGNTVHHQANERIIYLGFKDNEEINTITEQCDIALGSFAMDRNNLSESSTLKVREYLAMGIPVYSGVKDSSLPPDFPYYSYTLHKFDSHFLFDFYNKTKDVSRKKIRNSAEPYLDKVTIMKNFISTLRKSTL